MNGSSYNMVVDGRLFRKATLTQAVELYPPLVLGLRLGSISVGHMFSPEGFRVVIYTDTSTGIRTRILFDDHEKILAAASRIPAITLLSNSKLETVTSFVAVEFSDRGT